MRQQVSSIPSSLRPFEDTLGSANNSPMNCMSAAHSSGTGRINVDNTAVQNVHEAGQDLGTRVAFLAVMHQVLFLLECRLQDSQRVL